MLNRRSKVWFFVLEALASLAATFYATYVFFLFRDQYGLGNLGNLSVAALQGLIGAIAAWHGGRFAQRHGCFQALKVGFGGVLISLLLGSFLSGFGIQLLVLGGFITCACFIWPALEALVSEGEAGAELSRKVGIYNVVWGGVSALSYFCGGVLFDHLGTKSIFWLPASIFLLALFMVTRLAARPKSPSEPSGGGLASRQPDIPPPAPKHVANPRLFLWMAWLANPFAGIGINTVVAVIPGLARELHLSTTLSGMFCSVWFFARLGAFLLLWQWRGWQYRFRWLLGAFLCLMGGFAAILTARNLWALILAQLAFGFSVGLMYYSSLFYSMDVGETKGEHGGLHETMIAAGNFVGPALGAGALLLVPQETAAAGYAVTFLMAIGLVGLVGLRLRPVSRALRTQDPRR